MFPAEILFVSGVSEMEVCGAAVYILLRHVTVCSYCPNSPGRSSTVLEVVGF